MALAAQTDWEAYPAEASSPGNNLAKNNSSGFSALPGGGRDYDGLFYYQSIFGYWWSTPEIDAANAYYRYLDYGDVNLVRFHSLKSCGFSVRLLRDN